MTKKKKTEPKYRITPLGLFHLASHKSGGINDMFMDLIELHLRHNNCNAILYDCKARKWDFVNVENANETKK